MARTRKGDGLYKDPRSGNWQIDKAHAGQRLKRSSGTTSYAQAKAQVDAWIARLDRELTLERLGEKKTGKAEMTFREAVIRYANEKGALAKSKDQIAFQLEWLVENFGSPTLFLSQITERMILDAGNRRRAQGRLGRKKRWQPVSEHTIDRAVYDPLCSIMNRARKTWKVEVAEIDWEGIRPKRPKDGFANHELPESKEDEFYGALRDDLHAIIEFDMIHGCREGALRAMRWTDVDFAAGLFRVAKKSKHADQWQVVPLTSRSRELLEAQRGKHPEFVWTYEVHRSHMAERWVRKGELRPMTKTVMRQVKKAVTKIGLGHLRLHDIGRHTLANRLLRATGDLRTLQRVLGHSEIGTTAMYADANLDAQRAALEAVQNPRKTPGVRSSRVSHCVEKKQKSQR